MTAASLALSPAVERATRRSIAEFQSDTAEILGASTPLSARMTLHVLAAMVITAIALAAMVPVDRVVTARGSESSAPRRRWAGAICSSR